MSLAAAWFRGLMDWKDNRLKCPAMINSIGIGRRIWVLSREFTQELHEEVLENKPIDSISEQQIWIIKTISLSFEMFLVCNEIDILKDKLTYQPFGFHAFNWFQSTPRDWRPRKNEENIVFPGSQCYGIFLKKKLRIKIFPMDARIKIGFVPNFPNLKKRNRHFFPRKTMLPLASWFLNSGEINCWNKVEGWVLLFCTKLFIWLLCQEGHSTHIV